MREYFVWLAKLVTVLFIVIIGIPLAIGILLAASRSIVTETPTDGKKTVAVVELTGMIEREKDVIDELYRQVYNPKVKAVVLRIDSPGGAVGPSQDIYNAVRSLKGHKPIVASMGALAASGGLYSALPASKIFCQPGTLTGSIGVILQVPNFSKVVNWAGVDVVTIKSGKLKDIGNTFRDMTDEEKAFLESTTSRIHQDFMQAVSESRNIPLDKVKEFADGRVILGSQALDLKLVDAFGDVYDAARAALELAGSPVGADEAPTLFYPGDRFGELKHLIDTVLSIPRMVSRKMEFRYSMY